jgi:hypothetical protein
MGFYTQQYTVGSGHYGLQSNLWSTWNFVDPNDRQIVIDGAFERPSITREMYSHGVTLLGNRPGGGDPLGGLQPPDLAWME